MDSNYTRLPAEWEPQDAIMLSWPHKDTDWCHMLNEAQQCFIEIARAINNSNEQLIIVAPDTRDAKRQLKHLDNSIIRYFDITTNDTWARDTGPITTIVNGLPRINDFKFNGWGMKFAADLDNLITSNLKEQDLFDKKNYTNMLSFVLEGGSIESDGNGTLLTTSKCLLSPNRNGGHSKDEIENTLNRVFGSKKILWLDYGYLEGDDTDSHIDTLARFAPNNNILYVATNNTTDSHYTELLRMKEQLSDFCSAKNEPYKLTELPLPSPIYDDNGNRLPATYANFLIGNGFVLVPTYCQPENDRKAIQAIGGIFKGYTVAGIDCRALIQQHGSLHCVTMQFPKGSINL